MTEFGKALMEKSMDFAVRIVKLSESLSDGRRDFVLSRQVLRSGTSIGANVREAQFAQSSADFVSKLSIALKEAAETQFWLELLGRVGYVATEDTVRFSAECDSLVGMLVRAVKSAKSKSAKANGLASPTL